jgi:excisionase family DNA binding protein
MGYSKRMTETCLPRLLTLTEAAEALNCTPRTLQRRWKYWGLHPTKVGRELRFYESDLLAYLDRRAA